MHSEYQELDSLDESPIVGSLGVGSPAAGNLAAGQLAAEAAGHLQLLIELLDTISDRIFLINNLRQIAFVNEAFLKAYSLTREEVLGKKPEDVLPAEVVTACRKADQAVVERGDTIRIEMDWQDSKSGTRQWTETHKFPMRDSTGKITGIVGISRDITARRKAEEELKRSESLLLHASRLSSLGELAAGIAHEVNQPLFSILNYAKAIENKLQDDELLDLGAIREWIQQIHREAARGGKITQRLKSFVKPAEAHRKPSAISQIVLDALGFMAMETRDADVKIETELAEGLPELVVDRIQIQQVLVNLLKNAIESLSDHTTANPRVLISTRMISTGVEITVADNGPGVSIADGVNILDPFQTTKHDGIGLGLAISNTIVKAHQSELTYFSNAWGGTTFRMILPVTDQ